MGAHSYSDLRNHVGHKIECVTYGDPNDPENVAVECTTCNEVLMDFDKPEQSETICCGRCGHEYDRHIGDECPNCNHNNHDQMEEKYGGEIEDSSAEEGRAGTPRK
jgi:hypothetical protein